MKRETISDMQGITLLILFMIGSAIVILPGLEAMQDAWLAVVFSAFIGIFVSLIYARLLSIFQGKDLFDILDTVLGRTAGKIVSVLYIWYAFHLGALVMRNFGEFISVIGLTDTPMIVPMIVFSLLCAWAVKEGIESLGRIAEFFTPVLSLFLLLSILLLIPEMDIKNISPMFYDGIKPFIKGTFGLFSFPFAESVIFTMIFCCLKTNKSPYKLFIFGILMVGVIGTIITLTTILVLGADITSNAYFPTYVAFSRINIGSFLQSFEIVISLSFLIAGFIKISICMLACSRGVSRIFSFKNYRFIVVPVTLLMTNMSVFIYDNIKQMYHWALAIYPYYALLFQVILPVLILIAAEIKIRKN